MGNKEDIEVLKQHHMDIDYPENLNDKILQYIDNTNISFKNTPRYNSKINFYKTWSLLSTLAFAACMILIVTKDYNNDKYNDMSFRSVPQMSAGDARVFRADIEYAIFQDSSIVSIYPVNGIYNIGDVIVNIDKFSGEKVELRDLLLDNMEDVRIDNSIKELLLDSETRFYINQNGRYVILWVNDDGIIDSFELDDELKSLIFKVY